MEWFNGININKTFILFLIYFYSLLRLLRWGGEGVVFCFITLHSTYILYIIYNYYLHLLSISLCLHGWWANRDDDYWSHRCTLLAHETRGSPQVVGSNDEGGHPEGHGDAEGCIEDDVVLTDVLAVESSVLAIASVVHVVVQHGSIDDHSCNWGNPASKEDPEELQWIFRLHSSDWEWESKRGEEGSKDKKREM